MKPLLYTGILLLGLAVPAAGTDDDGMHANLELLRRDNDKLEAFTLPNGTRVLLKADHNAPVASVQIWVGTGSIHEAQFLGAGISHAVEHMLFKGTPSHGPGELTRRLHEAGGRVNAYTTFDRTVYFADLPAPHWKTAFDLLADAVMHASFPEDEWTLERDVIFREIAMGEDNPERVLSRHLWQTALRVHPYRHPVIGYTDAFGALTRDDLVTFFHRHYRPDNMMVVIVGDLDTATVRQQVEATFGPFARRPAAPVLLPAEPPQLSPRQTRATGDYELGRLAMAWPSVAVHHPDAVALDVLATLAGQGRTSRLHRALVEDHRLVHSVSAWSYTPGEPGLFGISAMFAPEREADVLAALHQEIDSLQRVPFSTQDVRKAVRQALVSELGGLATMSGQAARYGSSALFTGDPRFNETYLARLQDITPQTLQTVARRYLSPQTRSTALLVPAEAEASVAAAPPAPAADPPGLQRAVLDNGIILLVRENRRLPFVYMAAALKGGLRAESPGQRGITMLMADLLPRGTPTRSRDAIALAVEAVGASLETYSGLNAFGITAQSLTRDADTLLAVLADCLLNPQFADSELERQRELQLAAIRRHQEQPMFLAQQQLRDMLFPQHAYRDLPEGTPDTVAAITREALIAHHRALVRTGNLTLSLFGDISLDQAIALADTAFGTMPPGPEPEIRDITNPVPLPARAEQEAPRQQAIILAGFPGVTLDDPRYEALTVLQTAMSGLSAELALEIRDKRGLAYFTGAMLQAGLAPGYFALYAGTRREAIAQVETLFRNELERLTESGLREDELARAKAQLRGSHAMRLQDQRQLALECALHERYGLGANHVFEAPARIEAVSAGDIREAVDSILDPARMAISVILPADNATPAKPSDL